MRELITPGLFWVARLGVFLAVVMWLVGQWWGLLIAAGAFTYFTDSSAVVVVYGARVSADSSPIVIELSSPDHWWTRVLIELEFERAWHSAGIMATSQAISVDHWFAFSIFAVFYAVLKFVDRKRGGEVVDDGG